MVYGYYVNTDKKQEIIDKTTAKDYSEALNYFSQRKQLNDTVFVVLFTIVEIYGDRYK